MKIFNFNQLLQSAGEVELAENQVLYIIWEGAGEDTEQQWYKCLTVTGTDHTCRPLPSSVNKCVLSWDFQLNKS